MRDTFRVGIYARLSRDDNNGNLESMSIANQRQILSDYVNEKGWILAGEYIDDGYSGTNFDRPDFKRMLKDIECGKIDCVVTKDLSRLGRNYSMTGYYTDEYFPEQHCRYIAINDGVDTMGANNDFAAFHNVINEYYPRDISKKVRQVKRTNAEKGMFMGSRAPYGYKKSPEDKHQLIIDEETSWVIKKIFDKFINGENARMIADDLNNMNLLCPRAYYYQLQGKDNPRKDESMTWSSATILQIIQKQVYIGNMVQGQRQVVSFKSKKRRLTEPDEWIVVEGTHEPIISKDIWDEAQKIRQGRYYPRNERKDKTDTIFIGLVKCADCGATMCASMRSRPPKLTYRCGTYSNHGKSVCTSHNIREEVLEAIVLNDIRHYAYIANQDRDYLIKSISKMLSKDKECESSLMINELKKSEAKIDELNSSIKSLYKDKVTGKMSEKIFYNLLEDFESELKTYEDKASVLREKLDVKAATESEISLFADRISKCLELKAMNKFLARELIESITVSAYYKVDGETMQDVTINYKFVGNLKNLEMDFLKNAI